MKSRTWTLTLAALTVALSIPSEAPGQVARRTAGIAIRGSAWSLQQGRQRLVWQSDDSHTLFDGDGAGGWLSFLAPLDAHATLELSLGVVMRRVEEVKHAQGTDTYAEALVPLLAGMRLYPLASRRDGGIRPYVSLGAGYYWMGDIVEIDRGNDDSVSVDGQHLWGGYWGGGVDLMFTDWLGLNVDVKRHYVDFRSNQEQSGFELACGLQFMWGHRDWGRRAHGRH